MASRKIPDYHIVHMLVVTIFQHLNSGRRKEHVLVITNMMVVRQENIFQEGGVTATMNYLYVSRQENADSAGDIVQGSSFYHTVATLVPVCRRPSLETIFSIRSIHSFRSQDIMDAVCVIHLPC